MSMLRVLAITTVIAAPLFVVAPAFAGDDPAHPAYDFEPTVLIKPTATTPSTFTASTALASTAEAPAQPEDSKYPGAYFTPRVIYP